MAVAELEVFARTSLDNPEEIRRVSDELRGKLGLAVCFYTPPPLLMPIRQDFGGWCLRFVSHEPNGEFDMDLLAQLRKELMKLGFIIKRQYWAGNKGNIPKRVKQPKKRRLLRLEDSNIQSVPA